MPLQQLSGVERRDEVGEGKQGRFFEIVYSKKGSGITQRRFFGVKSDLQVVRQSAQITQMAPNLITLPTAYDNEIAHPHSDHLPEHSLDHGHAADLYHGFWAGVR
jgi:hypothetical protein